MAERALLSMAEQPSLNDLIAGIPARELDQSCTDENLREVSLVVTKWQTIAPFLGLKEQDEEVIQEYPVGRRRLQMLTMWKERFGSTATYRRLIEAFDRIGRRDLVDRVCGILFASVGSELPQPALTALKSYAMYLKDRYRSDVPTFLTQWPPVPTNKVVPLGIIKKEFHYCFQEPVRGRDVLLDLSLPENIVASRKTSIELKDVFTIELKNIFTIERPRHVILIEGAPGSGKTTLAWYVCQKWESGELFQEFDLVVLVQLRDFEIQSAKSLADILPCSSLSQLQDVVLEIEIRQGRGVLVILDGWDELPPSLQKSSFFQELLKPPRVSPLTHCSVIVTSRPIASVELSPLVSLSVQIVGFTRAQVKQYFAESLGHNSEVVQELEDQLLQNPLAESSCYLPLYAAIIVYLFFALECTLPTTFHGIFCLVVTHSIYRYMHRANRESEVTPITSFRDTDCIDIGSQFPPDIRLHLKGICKLAYFGIQENRTTFSLACLQEYGLSSQLCSLDLLQEVKRFVCMGKSASYSFLHLSVQELLAAIHISQMTVDEQVETFRSLFGHARLTSVLQFYSGITKLCTPGIQNVLVDIAYSSDSTPSHSLNLLTKSSQNIISILRCVYGAQNTAVCLYVAEKLQWSLKTSGVALHPSDCLAIGYFLACVCPTTDPVTLVPQVFKVNLSLCSLDDSCMQYLAKEVTKRKGSSYTMVNLDLHRNDIQSNGTRLIADILRNSMFISHLQMWGNDIGEDGLCYILQVLEECHSLVELHLQICSIVITADQSGPIVVQVLQSRNTRLRFLDLSHNQIADSGILYIVEGLRENTSLRTLYLRSCDITKEGVKYLAQALTVNKYLEEIDVSLNKIGDDGVVAMGESLSINQGLKVLLCSRCNVQSDETLGRLADVLSVNQVLQTLDLSNNWILLCKSDVPAHESDLLNLDSATLKPTQCELPGLLKLGRCFKDNTTLKQLFLVGLSKLHGDLFCDSDASAIESTKKSVEQFLLSLADNCGLIELHLGREFNYLCKNLPQQVNIARQSCGYPALTIEVVPDVLYSQSLSVRWYERSQKLV